MMQKKSYVRLIGVMLIGILWSATPLAAEVENALLWQIETPDGKNSYLFGTIHSDEPSVLTLPEPVASAFDNTDTLALEIDLGTANDKVMGQAMMLPADKDLLTLVGPELYRQSVIALGERGYPEGVTNRLQPWAIMMTLNMPQPKSGLFLDFILYKGAKEQGKKVVGLESLEEQLSVFTDLNLDDQITLLKDTLRDYRNYPKLFQQLIEAYLKRDLKALMALNEQEMSSSDKALEERLMRTLVEERNHRMIERMLPLLEQGSLFVAVGALHLPGDEGLITLLREQGLKLTPIY